VLYETSMCCVTKRRIRWPLYFTFIKPMVMVNTTFFCIELVCYSCIMYLMYTQARGPQAVCIYQENHEGMWYKWYVPCRLIAHGWLLQDSPLNSLYRPTWEIRLWNGKNYIMIMFIKMNRVTLTVSLKILYNDFYGLFTTLLIITWSLHFPQSVLTVFSYQC